MNQWRLIVFLLTKLNYNPETIAKAKQIEQIINKYRLQWNTPEYHFFFKQYRFYINSFSDIDILRIIHHEDFSTPCYVYQKCSMCPLREKTTKNGCCELIDDLSQDIKNRIKKS